MEKFNNYWKNTSPKSAIDQFVRCALKAINVKNQNKKLEIFEGLLSRAFSPITNKNKLNNGLTEYSAIKACISRFTWSGHRLYKDVITDEEHNRILELSKSIRFKYLDRKYIMVYVSNSLTPEQKVVQAAHGTHQLGLSESGYTKEPHFWVFGFENSNSVIEKLKKYKVPYKIWTEEDLDNKITSIVTYPVPLHKKRFFEDEEFLKM